MYREAKTPAIQLRFSTCRAMYGSASIVLLKLSAFRSLIVDTRKNTLSMLSVIKISSMSKSFYSS